MSAEQDQFIESLLYRLPQYLSIAPEIDVKKSKLHVGLYNAYLNDHSPAAIKISTASVKVPHRYYLWGFDPPIKVTGKENGLWVLDEKYKPDHKASWTVHITYWDQRVDFVKDNKAYMLAGGLGELYADTFAAMTPGQRAIYGRSLDDINELPAGIPDEDADFLRTLAVKGTYDTKGNYYEKWRDGNENMEPMNSHVTQKFVDATAKEVLLLKDRIYVLQVSDLGAFVFHVDMVDSEKLTRRLLFSASAADPSTIVKGETPKQVPFDVTIFMTADGEDKEWVPEDTKRLFHDTKKRRATARIVNPKEMVEARGGKKIGGYLGLKEDFDWFVEMVKLYFPLRFHVIDISRFDASEGVRAKLAGSPLRQHLREILQQGLDEAKKQKSGPVADGLHAEIKKFLDGNPDLLIFPQGFAVHERSLFIGFHDSLAYYKDMETGAVEMMPADQYIVALADIEVGKLLYDASKNAIIIIEVMMVITAAVAALGLGALTVAGSGLSVSALQSWLLEYAEEKLTSEAMSKALDKAITSLRPVFAGMILRLLTSIFAKLENDKNRSSWARWSAFMKGFVDGYLKDILYDHFIVHVLKDTVLKLMPREVRTALAIKKIYAALDKLSGIVKQLEDELDEGALSAAFEKFESLAGNLARGAALAVSLVYYLPKDKAQPILELFGLDPTSEPDPEIWSKEAKQQLGSVIGVIRDQAHQNGDSMSGLIDHIRKSPILAGAGVLAVLELNIIWNVEWRWHKHMSKHADGYLTFFAIVIGALSFADYETDGKVGDFLFQLLKDAVTNIPGKDDERAEFNGRIVGNLLGGVVYNNMMFNDSKESDGFGPDGGYYFKKGNAAHGLMMSNPDLGGVVWGALKYGVLDKILELIFARYVFLYDKLRESLKMTRDHAASVFKAAVDGYDQKKLNDEGFGHLKDFLGAPDKAGTFANLAIGIVRLHAVVEKDILLYIAHRYNDDYDKYKEDIDRFAEVAKKGGVDFHKIAAEYEQQMYHQMARHIHLALGALKDAIHDLYEPFTKNNMSWMKILHVIGLEVGDINKVKDEVMAAAKEELKSFKSPGATKK